MSEQILKLTKSLIVGFGFFLWTLTTSLYRAWALTMIWGWFLIGFMGIPALPIWVALGISFLVSFLTANEADVRFLLKEKKNSTDTTTDAYIKWFLPATITTVVLVSAWIWVLLRPLLFGI